jgi:hypothetical protein
MRALSRLSLVAVLAATAACDDERRDQVPTMPLEIAPDAMSAYVVVSNPKVAVGSQVEVGVRSLRGRNVGPIGSFTVRLAYDSTGLAFVKAASNPQGMVMANGAGNDVVVAAGASAQGFTNDELVLATFTVTSAAGLKSLSLMVSELNSLKFEDQRANLRVMKGIYRASAK